MSRIRSRASRALALALFAVPVAACFAPSSGGNPLIADFDASTFDGFGEDAGADAEPEAGSVDATTEVGAIDSGTLPDVVATLDSAVIDSATVDSTVVDSGAADSQVVDSSVPEAAPEADVDATPEASPEPSPEAAPEASVDASDAATTCIPDVFGHHVLFGDHYVRTDGTAVYAGGGGHVVIVDAATSMPLQPITEIVQQTYSACALRGTDGSVWCWPISGILTNANGELGTGAFGGTVPPIGSAMQVVTGSPDGGVGGALTGVLHLSTATDAVYESPTCALSSSKNVLCWGASTAQGSGPDGLYWGTTGSHANMPYAVAIAAGPAPGDGGPMPLVTADQISVGGRHACILSAGRVSCWGDNIFGNLGNGDSTYSFQPYPVPVVSGTLGYPATIDAVGAGYDFTCALAGGQIWCWGASGWNQVGDPSVPNSICGVQYCIPTPTPVQVDLPDGGSSQMPDAGQDQYPLSGIASMIVGYQFGCGLAVSGDIYCWGSIAAGSQTVPEARRYTSAIQPYSGVNDFTAIGEDWSALRYLTSSGVYVSFNQAPAPYCQ